MTNKATRALLVIALLAGAVQAPDGQAAQPPSPVCRGDVIAALDGAQRLLSLETLLGGVYLVNTTDALPIDTEDRIKMLEDQIRALRAQQEREYRERMDRQRIEDVLRRLKAGAPIWRCFADREAGQ